MIYELLGLQVESYGTWLLLQRLDDPSKDSDTPKNVPFAFAINNRNPHTLRMVFHTKWRSFHTPRREMMLFIGTRFSNLYT